jgi:hypothetical protein
LRGTGSSPTRDGIAHPVKVGLLTPTAGPDGLTWFCSNTGSTVTDDEFETKVDLNALGKFGTCATGVPVAGELDICDTGVFGDCHFKRSGTIDNMTIGEAE